MDSPRESPPNCRSDKPVANDGLRSTMFPTYVSIINRLEYLPNHPQIGATAHFANDLGLDSLDTVEVVMAIEEEFSIEIPDKDADSIHSGTYNLSPL